MAHGVLLLYHKASTELLLVMLFTIHIYMIMIT